jgi:hypothetical protein
MPYFRTFASDFSGSQSNLDTERRYESALTSGLLDDHPRVA